MTTSQPDKGEVYRRSNVITLDTREMEWEEFPGLSGARMKVLSRFESGEPSVFLVWNPPGRLLDDLPHRHYHSTVHEFHFFLEGEFPIWEYESPEDGDGELVMLKGGYYLERLPGSIHGIEAEPTSPVGSMVLIWRTATGNFVDEPNAKEESIEVPYPDR